MNTPEDTTDEMIMAGTVKWFDPGKGFGFVVCDQGGPDILLHANVLRNFGQGSVVDGSRIEMSVQRSDRGMQATVILKLTPPVDASGTPALRDMEEYTAEQIASQPILPARIKWFDKGKGLGSPMFLVTLLTYLCTSKSCAAADYRICRLVKLLACA